MSMTSGSIERNWVTAPFLTRRIVPSASTTNTRLGSPGGAATWNAVLNVVAASGKRTSCCAGVAGAPRASAAVAISAARRNLGVNDISQAGNRLGERET
jgi:hypothetical protein